MLIILEGPDCAGKSTLAQELAVKLASIYPKDGVTVLHRGPPKSHPLDEYVVPLLDYRPGEGQHIICDRWHLGELVYPEILKRETQLTSYVYDYIKMFLESRGAYIVIVQPNIHTIIERYRARGDGLLTEEQIYESARRFATLGDGYHVSLPYPDAEALITHAYHRESFVAPLRYATPVGAPFPRYMILGDTRGPANTNPNAPAFMPYPTTSGDYLIHALECNILLSEVVLANACDVDDVKKMWWHYGCPRIVTLGVHAHERLQTLNIPHSAVPHPQYIRRFHYAAQGDYGQLIASLIPHERNELQWRPTSSTARPARESTSASSKRS